MNRQTTITTTVTPSSPMHMCLLISSAFSTNNCNKTTILYNVTCYILQTNTHTHTGYIDLSKSKVAPEDIPKCEEKYNKSKAVHSVMRHLAEVTNNDVEFLYEKIGWPLYRAYGHAFDAFKIALTDPDQVFEKVQFPDENVKKELIEIIQHKLKPQPVKMRADIEVTCFSKAGIDAIKEALSRGEDLSTDDIPIKITLVAPPLYVMVTTTHDKVRGLENLEKAIKVIEETMKEFDGNIVVKAAPRVVNEKDDHSLSVLLEQLKEQNKEVDGDEASDEEDQ